ncbi:MAG TPA: DNA primase [Planctomycetota bacterium]|mgnify:CR=1 FL=1|jgi:DNA primase|nr:DNA primase [Planctomycetota bacterium]OQC22309.1 MAG: DNA primase [Planctomycetes bacterium ADurb.Bin069]HNS00613.1 DNA primase [Planctomycetota bacterium]HNU26734.1 DNA primase [Planctomycetota bacterium]HOE29240.1 DNA primase [Planctomycetota bacterium]
MARIPEETIRGILAANRVEDVVGRYVMLLPDGRNRKALCPFHREKTPSFKVHPDKQIYRCYGCGQSGNAIGFVMAMERVDFPTAVRSLAALAGIEIKSEDGVPNSLIEEARRANERACGFYQRQLDAPGFGRAAREYLEQRGFTKESVECFRIGAAPDAWDALFNYLRRERISPEAMVAAGLVLPRKSGAGWYDYFRGRVLFPIMDARGQVVGFGGRTLGGDEPKYLNTPETRFFRKGRLLYGLHRASESIRASRTARLVEGYTDVIMAVQHGVEGVVAGLGTALTRENARELRRHADTVVLAYDGDDAGVKAAERAIGPLMAEGVDVRVAALPAGTDPCDFLAARGGPAFAAALEEAREAVVFLAARASAADETGAPGAQRRAIERCWAPFAEVDDPLLRQLVRRRIAEAFGIGEEVLAQALRAAPARAAEEPRAAPNPYPGPEEMLAAAMLAEPALRRKIALPAHFANADAGALCRALCAKAGEDATIEALMARFAQEPAGRLLEGVLARIEEMQGVGELLDWWRIAQQSREEIERLAAERERRAVKSELDAARSEGAAEKVRELMARYQQLLRQTKTGSRAKNAAAPT